jgi:hypothetical protein
VTRKQFIVILLRSLVWCHIEDPKQFNGGAQPKIRAPKSAIDSLLQMSRVSIALHGDLRNSCSNIAEIAIGQFNIRCAQILLQPM